MKKLVALCAAAITAALLAGAVLAAPSFTQATGGLTLANPTQQLSFNAFDYGVSGDRGQVQYANPSAGVSYHATMYCATVDPAAGTAVFAYTIPDGNGAISGLNIVWKVTDGGSPGSGGDTAGFTAFTDQASATAACNDGGFTPTSSFPVTGGNLVVH